MPFRFVERPGTFQVSTKPGTATVEYLADGIEDDSVVQAIALSTAPMAIATATGILWRQDLQVKERGTKLYYVTVTYGEKKSESGNYSLSFDTTGGTVNIKVGKATVGYAASGTAIDYKGAIGVRDEGEVEGTDIVLPALKITANFRHPQGYITANQIKNLARNTGKMNSGAFLGFAAGEVLFMGATGSEGTDTETTIAYQFACSENLSNQVINGITVAEKRGWDVLWMTFEDVVDSAAGSAKARRPKHIYVSRVYDQFDMASFFGFG